MLSQNEDLAIGIDLGTTFSCVGVYHKGAVKIISNEDGNRITPSCVSFTDEGVLKGERAKQRLSMAPKNTVYEVKRLMGRSFDDPGVQADIKTWPFKVVDDGGKPKIRITQKRQTKNLAPEEISAMVLTAMKELAEKYLETPVTKVVITVPAYFNANQRYATENAARIAGLDVLRIINEPTAAAIAYYDEGDFPSGKNVLVFDIGGGTFDISILKFERGLIEVVATKGDTHLGGADFDERMVKKALEWFNATKANERVLNDAQSSKIIRLRNECERTKCRLSKRTQINMSIEDFHEGKDFVFPFNREMFEELNNQDFKKTIVLLDDALTDAKLNRDEIDDIVLVGGSSRIPKLQSLLKTYFKNKTLSKSINPDEAVAYGAALQAAVLNGDQGNRVKELLLLDVTPLSLGIRVKGGIMSTIVERNTLIPTSCHDEYCTSEDNQTRVTINVYQGERKLTADNQLIGHFKLKGIPAAPAGVSQIDVTIEIDTNGTIFVLAVDKTTGNEKHLIIKNSSVRHSQEEVKRMIDDAWSYRSRDEREYERVKAKNDLESYTNWMKYVTEEFQAKLTLTDQEPKIAATANWIQQHPNCSANDFKRKKEELQAGLRSIPSEYQSPGQLPGHNPSQRPTSRTSRPRTARKGMSVFDLD